MLRLTDDQWERIREHFPEENIPEGRPGRKPIPTREVLEAALWILNTGAQWHILPQCYPNYKTVHRRFQQWCEREVLRELSAQEKDFSPQRAGRAKGQGNESRGVCQQLKGNPHQRDHAPIMP